MPTVCACPGYKGMEQYMKKGALTDNVQQEEREKKKILLPKQLLVCQTECSDSYCKTLPAGVIQSLSLPPIPLTNIVLKRVYNMGILSPA